MFLLRLLPPLPRAFSLALVALLGGLFLACHGFAEGYDEVTGTSGTAHLTNCRPESGGWDELWADGWACTGSFESDDHSVRIEHISLRDVSEDHPDLTRAALVAGPDANTAVPDSSGSWKWPALTGLVMLAFAAWHARTFTNLLRERRGAGTAVAQAGLRD